MSTHSKSADDETQRHYEASQHSRENFPFIDPSIMARHGSQHDGNSSEQEHDQDPSHGANEHDQDPERQEGDASGTQQGFGPPPFNSTLVNAPLPMMYYPYPYSGGPHRPKRRQVKSACTNCQKACKKCDEQRPCGRCQRYGLAEECQDIARKKRQVGVKRGPYKRKGKDDEVDDIDPITDPIGAAVAVAAAAQQQAQMYPYMFPPQGQVIPVYGLSPNGLPLGMDGEPIQLGAHYPTPISFYIPPPEMPPPGQPEGAGPSNSEPAPHPDHRENEHATAPGVPPHERDNAEIENSAPEHHHPYAEDGVQYPYVPPNQFHPESPVARSSQALLPSEHQPAPLDPASSPTANGNQSDEITTTAKNIKLPKKGKGEGKKRKMKLENSIPRISLTVGHREL